MIREEPAIFNPTVSGNIQQRKDESKNDDLEVNIKKKSSFSESNKPKIQITWKNITIKAQKKKRIWQKSLDENSEITILGILDLSYILHIKITY